jgi:lipoprotein-anchoring transpeptidase ErfK/SrfK
MAFPRIVLVTSIVIFTVIGITAGVKRFMSSKEAKAAAPIVVAAPVQMPVKKADLKPVLQPVSAVVRPEGKLPQVDRISQLFTTGPTKLPIVETVTYSSNVAWLKGRPAWIGDYASYFSTSRHFIARSLNGKPDYFTQKVSPGSKFNVFKKDRNIQFHLLVDVSQCKMAFYYLDQDTNERILLKTYNVGLGKKTETISGTLTPLGKYVLGDKIAVYRPGIIGLFQDRQVEMIRVFGTRWIPFGKELGDCSAPAKGYGIHGAPWATEKKSGQWIEARQVVGQYESDGCIRLSHEDMEELFSVIITKPTLIEIVKNSKDAKLPGVEVSSPTR